VWGTAVQTKVLKRHLLASVGLISLTVASSAHAADINVLPRAPVAIWSWSGLYIGGHVGYGWGRDPFTDFIFGGKAPASGITLSGINSKGSVWGFHAGANWQNGAWVGGLEIDLSGTSIKGSSSVSAFFTEDPISVGIGITLSFTIPGGTINASFSDSEPSWRFGAVVGAGVEARLWDSNWLARVEYLHYDFGDSGSFSSSDGSFRTSGHLTVDVVRAGLSYKFGQGMAAFAGPAKAAMPVKAPRAAAVVWSWSGFYLGGHLGYGWGRNPFSDPEGGGIILTDIDSNGFVGGFQAGANWQSGAWVGGLEIDLSGTDIKGSTSRSAPTEGGTRTVTLTDKFDLLGSARARLGYLAWPNVLLYGTGGLAWTRLVRSEDDIEVGADPFASSSSNPSWRFGWVAGLGVETRLWDSNWLARLEYLHYDFLDSGSSFSTGSAGFTSGHLTVDVVRAALSYKFDWWGAVAGPAKTAMPVKARPAVEVAWDWTGFYLGGHAGYGWGRDPRSDAIFGEKAELAAALEPGVDSRGFVAGFQAGANWQTGAWVAGLEIDLSGTGIKGSTTSVAASETLTVTDKFDLLGSGRVRLGYLPWPNVLVYGTGGLAWTRFVKEFVSVFGGGSSGNTNPSWRFGWVAGIGGEGRLWNSNWLLRLEYLHYDFLDSGSEFEFATSGGLSASFTSTTGHLTADVVRAGLSYKFD
jgi:opacity protein-like surface antigen